MNERNEEKRENERETEILSSVLSFKICLGFLLHSWYNLSSLRYQVIEVSVWGMFLDLFWWFTHTYSNSLVRGNTEWWLKYVDIQI